MLAAKIKLEDSVAIKVTRERSDNPYTCISIHVSSCCFNHQAERCDQSNIRIQFQLTRHVALRLCNMEICLHLCVNETRVKVLGCYLHVKYQQYMYML